MITAIVMAGLLAGLAPGRIADADVTERAYGYNRDAMIAMSEAQFDEAIDLFQKAAALVPDYGITRRELRYTPNFMTGWAYEKLGQEAAACKFFGAFLTRSPSERVEASKADHATDFIARHCPSQAPPRRDGGAL